VIRDATPADFAALLTLNEGSVEFLSPLDIQRLERLHAMAAYHKVVEEDGVVAAFLLAFREGTAYDSPNYMWFANRHPAFVYIDRIVTSPGFRGRGHASVLYEDIAAFAVREGVEWLTCEFDVHPPNPASMQFHERQGFCEVGRQWLHGGTKQVSMQAKALLDSVTA
jgi:predicted GNAT superfamily acetyltransferase